MSEPYSKETQLARVWTCKAETPECSRSAKCASCRGRANRRAGQRKQRAAAKRLGIPTARFRGQNAQEEAWRDPHFRTEVKSGSQAGPAATRFLLAEKQADQNKAEGDSRPSRVVWMPKDWGNEGLVCVRLSVWESTVKPALDDYWGNG